MTFTTTDRYYRAAQEDRCALRITLDLPAVLRASGSSGFPVTLTDLSLGGCALRAVTGMRAGILCWLSVGQLKGLQAEVVWNDGQSIGLAFAQLLNPAVFDSLVNGR